ncbi:MAG: hypothetical protein WDL87_02100 [Candidatus Omnitrophota bacterium]|jgi:hypothetical protein
MKKIMVVTAVVLFMASVVALAAELTGKTDEQVSVAEQEKPALKLTTQSKHLDREMTRSWGNQKGFFIMKNLSIIDWEQAKTILLREEIRDGKQYHTGWLTIYTVKGARYLTKQPRIDLLFDFLKENKLSAKGFGTE